MLQTGRYVSEDNFGNRYVIDLKETDTSYIFTMVEASAPNDYDHLKLMFAGKTRKSIPKVNMKPGGHMVRVWDDRSFTIYPFQAGIPFYFKKEGSLT